jgi:phage gp36-like protein
MYVTLLQLLQIPGAKELAEVASSEHAPLVDALLLELTLTDGVRTEYSAEEIAGADAARARIEAAIAEVDGTVDGYLGRRYALPLASVPTVLAGWARSMVRYKLHPHRGSTEQTDPVVRDYRDAIKFLTLVADGKFSLGIADPVSQGDSLGEVQIESGKKVFGRDHLP